MKIGFLGTGTIASAMVQCLASGNHQIVISERNRTISAELSQKYSNVNVADNQTVIDISDVVIICLLADVAQSILPALTFRPDQKILSVMVGFSFEELSSLVSPAVYEAVFIPYPFIKRGNSPLLVYPQSDTLQALFGEQNELIRMQSEADLQSYLAAQAILLPTVNLLNNSVEWLQKRVGDTVSAEKFIRLLVGGYLTAESLDQPGVLAEAMVDLGTEGGLNAQLRDHFAQHGVYDALADGLDQLEKRLSD